MFGIDERSFARWRSGTHRNSHDGSGERIAGASAGHAPVGAIRLATAADVPELRRLVEASVRGLSTDVYSPDQIDRALVHAFGVDSEIIADGTYFVIVEDDQIIAAGGWSTRPSLFGGDRMKGFENLTIDRSTASVRIRAFFVHPDWARRGLGRRLFDACRAAARARGFTRFELLGTLPGVPLYRALGFADVEPVDVPLGDGLTLPCIRMAREIGLG